MAAVAPPPAPAAAPAPGAPAAAPAPAAAAASVADQTTDLLQKLSLDSQPKAADATEPAGAKKGAAASQPLSVSIPPERSITPVLQDFMDPNLFYLPAYYYGGYDGTMSEWDDYPRYLNPDGVEIAPAVYGDIYGYGLLHQFLLPLKATCSRPVNPEKPAAKADPAKTTANGVVPNGTAHSNSGTVPLASSHQNSSLTPDGTYRAPLLGGVPSAGYLDSTYGVRRTEDLHLQPDQLLLHIPIGCTQALGLTLSMEIRSKTGLAYGSNGYDSRIYGRWGVGMDNRYRPRGRGNGYYGYGNESQDGTIELNRGPRSGRFKNQKLYGHTVTIAVKGQSLPSGESKNDSAVPDKAQFNRDDFPVQYDAAKFFVIKSYSEDDIHKSIKYNVWASTTNGNKKLDAAYQEAQSKGSACPIFLFFSVNTSGQFVGVAEMTGAVDFEKTLEYWQQDKWNGSFSVKWHIVKDVPNNILKHIILENNENKPVTNSRDTQEVHLEQGLQMLKIFKEHASMGQQGSYFSHSESKTRKSLTGSQRYSVPNGVNGDLKAPTENVAAPIATYASKVAQSAAEKPVVANGVAAKTG
ncbi:hypothetical protein PR202_ga26999 [Eleusine coracana subsp. coracana]|uniref:YTH domain-containing family protein n=1 Tax=Eleusine coracana subsp. coracana TaxID=191504 RepID=A0AAV5DEV0_ELECO|nr:hypothetical protein PR202_ga26999 [Eleusine coracana subsp. coracana]